MRLFLAIELPEEVRERLVRIQQAWPVSLNRGYSRTRAENLHITLKFLGETPDERVAPLCEALGQLPARAMIPLRIDQMVFFPPRGAPRIVGAGPSETTELIAQLHEALEAICQGMGFPREGRAYRPHVTLARARTPLPSARGQLEQAAASILPCPGMEIDEFVLMQSELLPRGARYTPLARFPFRT
jgi:2'-5' RNA ligase